MVLGAYHAEDAPHHPHRFLIYLVTVSGGVVLEAVS
jgi:hypothetical protein